MVKLTERYWHCSKRAVPGKNRGIRALRGEQENETKRNEGNDKAIDVAWVGECVGVFVAGA